MEAAIPSYGNSTPQYVSEGLQDLHLGITNCGTPLPQGGGHRAGEGAALLELHLAAGKKQPAVPGIQTRMKEIHNFMDFPSPLSI